MKIKQIATIIATEVKLTKAIVSSSLDEAGAKMLKGSKRIFDPYTSTVYDELMDERITRASNMKEASKMARTIIVDVVKEMDI